MPQRSSCAPKTRTSLSSSGESHAVTEGSRSKDIGSVCNQGFLKVERGNMCGFVCLHPYDGTCMRVWMNICMNIYSATSRKISHRSLGLLHLFLYLIIGDCDSVYILNRVEACNFSRMDRICSVDLFWIDNCAWVSFAGASLQVVVNATVYAAHVYEYHCIVE